MARITRTRKNRRTKARSMEEIMEQALAKKGIKAEPACLSLEEINAKYAEMGWKPITRL